MKRKKGEEEGTGDFGGSRWLCGLKLNQKLLKTDGPVANNVESPLSPYIVITTTW